MSFPVLLENTNFSLSPAVRFPINELVSKFLNYGGGEKAHQLRTRLRGAIADRSCSTAWVVADEQMQPVALYAQRKGPASLEVPLLRAVGPLASTLSRHVAHIQRQRALQLGLPEARVCDDMLSASFRAALAAEGYRYDEAGAWRATPRRGVLRANAIGAFGRSPDRDQRAINERLRGVAEDLPRSPRLAADLERELAPLKVLGAGIRSYLVPIKSHWAAELFDSALSRGTLFGRDPALGISREHVYYSGALRPPRIPARIVWYVSGAARAGSAPVRSVSTIQEAVVDRPGTLYRRYQHLGVWKRDEVLAAARNGKVLALRFSDTELLNNPLSLAELRSLCEHAGHTLVLRSIAELPEHLFASIYERGTDGHD